MNNEGGSTAAGESVPAQESGHGGEKTPNSADVSGKQNNGGLEKPANTESAETMDSQTGGDNVGNDKSASLSNEKQQQSSKQNDSNLEKQTKADLTVLPTRAYLDQTVVPILLQAMSQLARERPAKPIQFLSDYLLQNKDKFNE